MKAKLVICAIVAISLAAVAAAGQGSAFIVIQPADISAVLGDTLFLPCVGISTNSSVAPTSIAWQREGVALDRNTSEVTIHSPVIMERDGTVVIKSVLELCLTDVDVGTQYSCNLMQHQHTLDQVEFSVHRPVQIIVAPADMTVNASQSVSVMCVAKGLPLPNIVWLKNGNPIMNSSLHTIQERRENRADVGPVIVGTLEICPGATGGEYMCMAENIHTSMNTSFAVNIPVTADSQTPPIQNVTINTDEAIYCDFHGYPMPSFDWRFNDEPVSKLVFTAWHQNVVGENGVENTRAYLSFKPHSLLLTGVYTCTAQQNQHKAECHVTTNVQVPAEILVAPVHSQTISSSVVLSCSAYGIPPPSISWKYKGTSIPGALTRTTSMEGIHIVKSFLELCPEEDSISSGRYSCVVDNNVHPNQGSSIKSASFDICYINPKGFGVLVTAARTVEIEAGTAYLLPCLAYSLDQRPINITWVDDEENPITLPSVKKSVVKGDIRWHQSVLEIGCATNEHAKKYQCVVSDGIERSVASFDLHYTFAPVLQGQNLPVTAFQRQQNEDVALSCIISGQPLPTITWLKDDLPLLEANGYEVEETLVGSTTLNSTLLLAALSLEHSGDYWCMGKNKLGQTEMTMPYTLEITLRDNVEQVPLAPGEIQNNKATAYASYSGSILSVLTLATVFLTHLGLKKHREKTETIQILNFCIATSLLYIFYIPSTISGPRSREVCALLSSLFHFSFLLASFSISNLLFLGQLHTHHRIKVARLVALALNWGLPLLIWVMSISPGIQYYYNTDNPVCIPMKWALWLGLILPTGLLHLLTWLLLFVSPAVCRTRRDKLWLKEIIAIGLILFLFEVAWGIQLAALSTAPDEATTATLQSLFILASGFLGFTAVMHFCFLQPLQRNYEQPLNCESFPERSSFQERNSFQELTPPLSKSSVDAVEVVSLPNLSDEGDSIVSKTADL